MVTINFKMILPIGNNCMNSIILNDLNIRKCSYPFDWLDPLDLGRMLDLVFDVISLDVDKCEDFCYENFNPQNENKYKIRFVHDHEADYKDTINKYIRRVRRLKDDILNSPYILLVYISRVNTFDEKLYKIYDYVRNLNPKVYLYCVNGFKDEIKPDYKNNVFSYKVEYICEVDEKNNIIWNDNQCAYDQRIYRHNITSHFTINMVDFLDKIETFSYRNLYLNTIKLKT